MPYSAWNTPAFIIITYYKCFIRKKPVFAWNQPPRSGTHWETSAARMTGSIRIAGYACNNQYKLRLWQPKRGVVQELSHLAATRSRLISVKKQLKVPLKEHAVFSTKRTGRQNSQVCSHSLKAIDADIARADKAIEQLIAGDGELSRIFNLVTSVSGVGKVNRHTGYRCN